jgi:hypothetical protein
VLPRFAARLTKVFTCVFRAFWQKFSLDSEGRYSRGIALIMSIPYFLAKWKGVGQKGVRFIFYTELHHERPAHQKRRCTAKSSSFSLTLTMFLSCTRADQRRSSLGGETRTESVEVRCLKRRNEDFCEAMRDGLPVRPEQEQYHLQWSVIGRPWRGRSESNASGSTG